MKNKLIILDTETTDAGDTPWMIQLWYIVCDLYFREIKRENLFFKTDKVIDFEAMAIHHITPEILLQELAKDPRTDEEKKALALKDFENAYLVAHNSPFDKNVLDCNGIVTNPDNWIDTYNIAYATFDDHEKHSLQYLRYALDCTFHEEINPHDALSDVIVLKEVFTIVSAVFSINFMKEDIQMFCEWNGISPQKVFDEMEKFTQRWIILRKWVFGKYKWMSFEESFNVDPWYFDWMYNSKINSGDTSDAVFNTLKFYLKR